MFLTIAFGIVYVLATCVAGCGCLGAFNFLLDESDIDVRWWHHALVWLASVAALAGLIAVAISNQWI
ncbi:hypothetical protein HS041_12245 [Planomonospora sp. ID67723]|uniref:hypothetical protein n=1 Tax=Planomonospora sp. ID67723 TaxID=2738134 RepID=UPI0018C3BE33|nr:hypothetical protein [Planomonospora sp. ID67723]MBG0828539.1 hypothetical protein [Planomonospora sp. ID67723]